MLRQIESIGDFLNCIAAIPLLMIGSIRNMRLDCITWDQNTMLRSKVLEGLKWTLDEYDCGFRTEP